MTMRMKNPAFVLPDAMKGIQNLLKATGKGGVPRATLELIGLRASQLNGCSACLQGHYEEARKAEESDERVIGVVAWRESPYFSDAERAALALTDAVTLLDSRSGDAVPDDVWNEAVKHYDEEAISAIIIQIVTLNLFNRINVTVKEQADKPSWKS